MERCASSQTSHEHQLIAYRSVFDPTATGAAGCTEPDLGIGDGRSAIKSKIDSTVTMSAGSAESPSVAISITIALIDGG
jgi:hypothetical protein